MGRSANRRVFAIYQNCVGLDWVGKCTRYFEALVMYKYYMKSNERRHNPRPQHNARKLRNEWLGEINIYIYTYIHIYENQRSPQAKATTQPTKVQKKNWLEVRFWPILATFSSVGLALGWEIRRFHTIFIDFFFPTQHSLVNRQHLNVRTDWAFI